MSGVIALLLIHLLILSSVFIPNNVLANVMAFMSELSKNDVVGLMALSSRVTANYVRCKKCGYQHECKLRTDAHVPDDYREVDSGFIR
jgi:hypothetical protein